MPLSIQLGLESSLWCSHVSSNADHPDAHYCPAIFKQFAIMFRDYTTMVSVDDKKIGESNFPVASVDRGTVLVGPGINFVAGDHDFTKAKVTPSVALICAKTLVNLFSRGTYLSLKRTQSFSLLVQAIMQLNWKRSW